MSTCGLGRKWFESTSHVFESHSTTKSIKKLIKTENVISLQVIGNKNENSVGAGMAQWLELSIPGLAVVYG